MGRETTEWTRIQIEADWTRIQTEADWMRIQTQAAAGADSSASVNVKYVSMAIMAKVENIGCDGDVILR